ncbi:MAG: hypothetical protein AVDCRST_MAG79-2682, partial [uncultured Thermoleophilia bacterium]
RRGVGAGGRRRAPSEGGRRGVLRRRDVRARGRGGIHVHGRRRRHLAQRPRRGHALLLRTTVRRTRLRRLRPRLHGRARVARRPCLRDLQRRQLGGRRPRVPGSGATRGRPRSLEVAVLGGRGGGAPGDRAGVGRVRGGGDADLQRPRVRRSSDDGLEPGPRSVHPHARQRLHAAQLGRPERCGARHVAPPPRAEGARGADAVGAVGRRPLRRRLGGRTRRLPATDAREVAQRRRDGRHADVLRRLPLRLPPPSVGELLRAHDAPLPVPGAHGRM